jgi:hypothetical protein
MSNFGSAHDAKEFLVAKIVEEAQREGISLPEVERKMLYFSETDWTLPDIRDVSDTFNREYDEDDYERKIARLISNARTRARKENAHDVKAWADAVRVLAKGDHYLSLLIDQAASIRPVPPHDTLKLWGAGLLVSAGLLVLMSLLAKFGVTQKWAEIRHDQTWIFVTWVAGVTATGAYLLMCVVVGRYRMNRLIAKVIAWIPGRFQRDN